jgi:hypothetical protein
MTKLALITIVVAGLGVSAPASTGLVRSHAGACSTGSAWEKRQGGISEIVSCGRQGVKGNREQFVKAITRPVERRTFLRQLAH